MRKITLLCLLCLSLGVCSARASTGSTNPSDFPDSVDWCVNYGCLGHLLGTPQAWLSMGGRTGMVGNVSLQDFDVVQQGNTWNGNYSDGMGVIYNGVSTLGNNPEGILVSFDNPVFGAGAYIQATFPGAFTASITLFGSSFNQLGIFSAPGYSDTNVGTALFIGAVDSAANVSYAIFDTTANGFHDEDFSIGTLGIANSGLGATPEPGTLLLVGPSMLCLSGVIRRKLML